LSKITSRIQEKVMNSTGTWIDWQYLLDAANLLKKVCLYFFYLLRLSRDWTFTRTNNILFFAYCKMSNY